MSSADKTVIIVGALDTKGAEFAYVRNLIEQEGLRTRVVDFGVMGEPLFAPDIDRKSVAAAGGGDLQELATGKHKDRAMQVMADGLAAVVYRLHQDGQLDGIISMGGSGGTSIATAAMRTLPVGVPKVMVSTVGGGDISAFAGTKDITFIPSIVDVAGINRISRRIYANGAAAIAGMVRMKMPDAGEDRPLIVASMFGNTTAAVNDACGILTKRGYETLIFHATGAGGRTMEDLIADGQITAVLDITTTELADEVCGGVFSAGAKRCMAAATAGLPTVLVPGCVDMANFGAIDTVPERYRQRVLYKWNPNVTLLRTDVMENVTIGKMLAAAANSARGPTAILLPLKGVSMLDSEGGKFWDPQADRACFDTLKQHLRRDIPVIELDHNINDAAFSTHAAHTLLDLVQRAAR